MKLRYLYLTLLSFTILSCDNTSTKKEAELAQKEESADLSFYPIQPVDIRNVKLTDEFWLPIIKRVQQKTIEYAIEKCTEEGRLENFLIAGGKMEGETRGEMPFDDTDVYKIIEGASNSLISSPDEQLETLLDSLISIVATGQEEDGYLTTWRTIDPDNPPAEWVKVSTGERWDYLNMSHELYNAGHLYEAAAVHYKATGKKNFLNIALKNADLMVKTFGDDEGKIPAVPGHQIIETGLIKLYQLTDKKEYLELARYFLDHRGDPDNHELYGSYSQDHIPVTDQREVVGHAVRAVYMYAAMTDIAALQNDKEYRTAVDSLWHNMVNKKLYLTGGIGAKHDGEAFGENYELPNLTAYSETCAAIGSVYWNNRLFNLTGDVKYYDVLERTLYNGLISGISLDGTNFFYPNALEADGKYEFNRGACTRQGWFDCSCCPTNLIRFIPAIPGLIYAKQEDNLYVNLYAGNTAEVELASGEVQIEQTTSYPWNGQVKIVVNPKESFDFTLKLRVPGWARNEVVPGDLYSYADSISATPALTVNGEKIQTEIRDGYIAINRTWKAGEEITLEFPMQVREVMANEKVEEDRNKVALEYGPLVYAMESMDNPEFDQISISNNAEYAVQKEENLLDGVNSISANVEGSSYKAIPYYAWSNRGVGKMKVWLPQTNQ